MAKTQNPNTCENSGQPFEESTTNVHGYTGYRTCTVCGKSVAGTYGKERKVRWHTKAK